MFDDYDKHEEYEEPREFPWIFVVVLAEVLAFVAFGYLFNWW